jgi:hypothetical protein
MITTIMGTLVMVNATDARDTRLRLSVSDALEAAAKNEKFNDSIKLYFGDQPHPAVKKSFGAFTSNKKTNFFNKSDKEGCEWAFLSAVLSFQDRVKREGGDAVINIKSVYRGGDFSSATEYECGAGAIVGGVSLQGEVVKF